jgi:hypothetical protein
LHRRRASPTWDRATTRDGEGQGRRGQAQAWSGRSEREWREKKGAERKRKKNVRRKGKKENLEKKWEKEKNNYLLF